MSSSSTLELEAPAKLNLCLEVLGRRPDGYHEIDSVFAAIDLCDTVRLERGGEIRLTVRGEAAPEDETNLAWRAAEALGVGASITLDKRIPAGAGLGGGSSDAAAVLMGLDRLYGLGIGRERLSEIALELGADVPFFLTGGTARCRGVGERIEPLPPAPGRRYLLAIPALATVTRDVYGGLEPGLTGNPETATVFVRDYYRREGPGRFTCFNRLQAVAERLDPRLREVRRSAEDRYGCSLTLTGSGSAYFGLPGGEFRGEDRFETGESVPVRVVEVRTR